jgi:biofilm protein TabA
MAEQAIGRGFRSSYFHKKMVLHRYQKEETEAKHTFLRYEKVHGEKIVSITERIEGSDARMIFDDIRNVGVYSHGSALLRDSIDFILNNKFSYKNPQTFEIGKEGIYAIPQEYTLKKMENRSIESHRKYIDIQMMIEGMEYLGYADKSTLDFSGYDEEHDTERLTGTLAFLPFRKDCFAVLFPQDAHMPGVQGQNSTTTVKKIVIKVPLGLWQLQH